ncbi:MAG: flagellar motor stator protein MotA [Candidatus Tectimicrobiota bacterium]
MGFVGILIVIGAVLGGFIMEGGEVLVLNQPAEYVIILGAALGTMIIATPIKVIIQMIQLSIKGLLGASVSKAQYVELLNVLYELFQMARKDGQLALEPHVEDPEKSTLFSKYPSFLHNHHAVHFLADTVRVILAGGVAPHDLEALMDADIETHHEEAALPVAALSKVGDAMPGLGIVAAVLGIVITMGAIGGPPEEIGHKVGAALVGTFLGILISYGFLQPIAASIETVNNSEGRYILVLKSALLAFASDAPPIVAVEFARRTIFSDVRPSFKEMEEAFKNKK